MPDAFGRLRNGSRQFREMTRLFFGRFLENDLICLDGDKRASLAGVFTALIAPGVMVPLLEYLHYTASSWKPLWVRDMASLPEKAIYIAFSMTVLGIVTVIEWDALVPDSRDYAVLRPFPIRLSTLFAAKITALAGFWAIFTVAINAVPAALFPMAIIQGEPFGNYLWFVQTHALVLLAANAFIFLSMMAVQGVLMNLVGWRRFRRVAPYAQLLLVTAIVVTFFLSIGAAPRVLPSSSVESIWRVLPPVWFLGLYQSRLGWTQPVYGELAAHARWALAIVAVSAAAAYAMSYRRSVSRSLEDLEGPAAAPGAFARALWGWFDRVLLRTPAEKAVFHFVRQTLLRSRSHRMLVAAYAGAGFALVFHGIAGIVAAGGRDWWQSPKGLLLPVIFVLYLFLLSGIRYAFTVPAELRANWVFRLSGTGEPAEYLAGVRKAVALLGIVPLAAVLLPIHVAIWGWTAGCVHVLYGATVAWLLMEALLAGFEKLPFTCSLVPGKGNLRSCWPFLVIGYLLYVAGLSALELLILESPARFFWFLLGAAAVKAGIDAYRRRVVDQEYALIYDDRPEPAVTTLELQQ